MFDEGHGVLLLVAGDMVGGGAPGRAAPAVVRVSFLSAAELVAKGAATFAVGVATALALIPSRAAISARVWPLACSAIACACGSGSLAMASSSLRLGGELRVCRAAVMERVVAEQREQRRGLDRPALLQPRIDGVAIRHGGQPRPRSRMSRAADRGLPERVLHRLAQLVSGDQQALRP